MALWFFFYKSWNAPMTIIDSYLEKMKDSIVII